MDGGQEPVQKYELQPWQILGQCELSEEKIIANIHVEKICTKYTGGGGLVQGDNIRSLGKTSSLVGIGGRRNAAVFKLNISSKLLESYLALRKTCSVNYLHCFNQKIFN